MERMVFSLLSCPDHQELGRNPAWPKAKSVNMGVSENQIHAQNNYMFFKRWKTWGLTRGFSLCTVQWNLYDRHSVRRPSLRTYIQKRFPICFRYLKNSSKKKKHCGSNNAMNHPPVINLFRCYVYHSQMVGLLLFNLHDVWGFPRMGVPPSHPF